MYKRLFLAMLCCAALCKGTVPGLSFVDAAFAQSGCDDPDADPDLDTDGDGTPDCADLCPADGTKIQPGQCGCGVADTDGDKDGVANCVDACPADQFKTTAQEADPLKCGCGFPLPTVNENDGQDNPCDDVDSEQSVTRLVSLRVFSGRVPRIVDDVYEAQGATCTQRLDRQVNGRWRLLARSSACSATFTPTLPLGRHTLRIVASYKDADGDKSQPLQRTFTIRKR